MAAKTICVWGKNGCGKTALAFNLAAWLAQNKNLVGYVSAEDYAEIPTYLGVSVPSTKGLKAAKDAPTEHIKNFYFEPIRDFGLFVLSPAPDCDSFDLAGFDKAFGRRVIQESKEVFDILIIDCTTHKENAITGEALALSDAVVIPVNDDITYPQWYQSNSRIFDAIKVRTYFVESMTNGYANIQAIFKAMNAKSVASIQYNRNAPALINEGSFLYRGGKEQKLYEYGLSSVWSAISKAEV